LDQFILLFYVVFSRISWTMIVNWYCICSI